MGIHILHVEHAALLAFLTMLTVANSWMYKGIKGIHWFTLYNLLAFLGALAVALRGQIPGFLSIVGGDLSVVAAYFALYLCLAALLERKAGQLYIQYALVVVAVVTLVLYGSIYPDTKDRLIAYSAVLGLQQAHSAYFIWRKGDANMRVSGSLMASIMVGLSLTNGVRVVGVLLRGAPANYLNAGPFLEGIVIVTSSLQCGAMVAYVWLTAALLRSDLEFLASTDSLTRLLNRRAIEQAAERQLSLARQSGAQLCAITIDLDDFKQINDSFGHQCGDTTLIAVAQCLREGVRKTDLVARIGGDEFAVLLPETSLDVATEIAERIRSYIDALEISQSQATVKVTASFGMAEAQSSVSTWEQLVMRCDQALYSVKKARGSHALPVSDRRSPAPFEVN